MNTYESENLTDAKSQKSENPWPIMNDGDLDGFRLAINLFVSAIGGGFGLVFAKMIYTKFNK